VDATSRLIARVEAIENAADPTTTGVQLAQTSMGRLDAIVNEVAELKMQLAADLAGLTNNAALTGSANGLEWHKDRVISKKWEIRNNGRESRKKILAKINAAKAKVGVKAAQVRSLDFETTCAAACPSARSTALCVARLLLDKFRKGFLF
jgi:hypothetical protein